MQRILGPEFFNRSTPAVAKDLLGKFLVRRHKGKTAAYMITETEAYHGLYDKASHAHRGQTPRNTPMFGVPGTIYVYFTYGMHWMLNLVCGKEGYPAAVLIRGVVAAPLVPGKRVRLVLAPRSALFPGTGGGARLDGPAKLTKFLGIDKSLNAKQLGKKAGLWVEDRGVVVSPRHVARTPRIGIRYAEEWVEKPWRFVFADKPRAQ